MLVLRMRARPEVRSSATFSAGSFVLVFWRVVTGSLFNGHRAGTLPLQQGLTGHARLPTPAPGGGPEKSLRPRVTREGRKREDRRFLSQDRIPGEIEPPRAEGPGDERDRARRIRAIQSLEAEALVRLVQLVEAGGSDQGNQLLEGGRTGGFGEELQRPLEAFAGLLFQQAHEALSHAGVLHGPQDLRHF